MLPACATLSADALAKLCAYGWEADADLLHDSHYGFEFTELLAHTYANAFARASVTESVRGHSVAGIDASYKTPAASALFLLATSPSSASEQALAARVKTGLSEVSVSGELRGKPVVIVHGRSDALIPVNHNSRPYAALNKRVDSAGSAGSASGLRYYEVTDANHFDALVGM